MKSSVSIKALFVTQLILFMGATLLCYFALYRPKIIKAARGTKEVASLERTLEGKMQELKRAQSDIERLREQSSGVQTVPVIRGIPRFLEGITDAANRLDIRILSVKPMPPEESHGYTRYPFQIKTKSIYGAMVKFIHTLEDRYKLSVERIHIENDPKEPLWHHFECTVTSFQRIDRI